MLKRTVDIIYGRTGSGKSVLARALLLERCRQIQGPGLVIDTLAEYEDLPALAPDESISQWLILNANRPAIARVLADSDEHLVIVKRSILSAAVETGKGPVVVLLDEVGYWSSPNWISPGLSYLVRYGRHWRVSLICVARRPAETARELSAQVTQYRLFRQVEPRDLQYLSGILPAQAMTILQSMGEYEYLKYSVDGTYIKCPPVRILSTGQN